MGRLEQTQFHKVFSADLEGNTLVVAPRGDAVSFRDTDVAGELKTLIELTGTPGIVNLVVDLGSSNYFGSTMIGAINQLGSKFRDKGGRIALCNVSSQMADVLEIMHLSDVWMTFNTRKIALHAMSKT
jgi:anti-sigma B factor antagonist